MSTHKSIQVFITTLSFAALVFTFGISAYSQTINEEVTVIGAFEPKIPDANKINIEPPSSETTVNLPVMTYSNRPDQMLVTLKPESIGAVKLVGEPHKKLYSNYVRAGFGTYTTPFVDLYANSLRSKTHSLGVHLKHISSSGEIEGYPIANNSLNLIDLYGDRFLDQHTLSANLGYRRNAVHHYGFLTSHFPESEYIFEDEDLKQRFNRIHGTVGIKSNYSQTDRFNHFAKVKFTNINDLFETRESNIDLSIGAEKQFELLEFTDNQQIGLLGDIGFTSYKDSTLTQNSTLISLKPFISTSFNEYSIKAGLNINFKLDTVSQAFLFPFVEGRLRIIEDALVVHAGITGGISRQSFDALSDMNPYVQSILPLEYTRDKFTIYGGVKARVGSNIDFNGIIRSTSIANASFFVNDYSVLPYNRFTLVHDDGQLTEVRLEAQFHSAEKMLLRAFTEFKIWSLDSLPEAYHTPALKFGIDAMYQIQNKIILRANVALNSQQYALAPPSTEQGPESVLLKGFADISFGVEYRYTKVLSGFINFNNVTNTRYFVWNNYPSYKFNLMGGVAYSF